MTEINYELLDTVHKFIHRNPEFHHQSVFASGWIEDGAEIVDQNSHNVCGTTMCFAGWTAILAGHYQLRKDSDMPSMVVNPANGQIDSMCNVATNELGLTDKQEYALFFESQTMEDVDNYVDYLHSLK